MKFLGLVFVAIVGFGLWVRLAPSDPARWHVPVSGEADKDFAGGVLRVIEADPDAMGRLDGIIRETPRTQVLAGSVEAGRITYVTRSKLWGFPDYTTVERRDGQIVIYGRLRFGRSDMGVNTARVERWLAALAQR